MTSSPKQVNWDDKVIDKNLFGLKRQEKEMGTNTIFVIIQCNHWRNNKLTTILLLPPMLRYLLLHVISIKRS
jgi:hypothetical protein